MNSDFVTLAHEKLTQMTCVNIIVKQDEGTSYLQLLEELGYFKFAVGHQLTPIVYR